MSKNDHSLGAWRNNRDEHEDRTKAAALAVWRAKEKGLTSTELSVLWQVPEHRSCGSALSRAKKKYPYILYVKQNGETHGRYYHSAFLPKEGEE